MYDLQKAEMIACRKMPISKQPTRGAGYNGVDSMGRDLLHSISSGSIEWWGNNMGVSRHDRKNVDRQVHDLVAK